ncbi:SPJ_0845 family protein [Vagococcus xieshaowenii]|uniref:Uncharacterized protein n=1 Tax=Vagococcus xieshaowenii TaxID=2562451 RepID=A0AAJ5EEW1_9ENTE|nr:SPJ_0845 family protein [Vagococcus xieshaowenii]QCA28340.1 hypothetical protein E4Z98_03065 [Vagococcus xieshaowenii]TFZ42272.1 hypothetical protein E4031_03585 [Vagococcus xieshaowenii]
MAIKYNKTDELDKKFAEFIVDLDTDLSFEQEEMDRRNKIAQNEADKFIELEKKAQATREETK